jgi:hypothetical protein
MQSQPNQFLTLVGVQWLSISEGNTYAIRAKAVAVESVGVVRFLCGDTPIDVSCYCIRTYGMGVAPAALSSILVRSYVDCPKPLPDKDLTRLT